MGRAGGRAGEGVSPLHAASGFNSLQQNTLSHSGVKQSSYTSLASPGNQNPHQMAYDQGSANLQSMNDLQSLLPQLSSTNSVNELLLQYCKAQHEQQQANTFQQAGASTAQLQAQILGARNGQFAKQLSQMMSANQVMLGNSMMPQTAHSNFDGVQAAAQRLGSGSHALQVSFDLANQQQNMLSSPVTRPLPNFQTEALAAQNAQEKFLSAHQHVSSLQNAPQSRSNNPAFSFGNSVEMSRSGQQQQEQQRQQQLQQQKQQQQGIADIAAESSGADSADEGTAAGKGARKEARKEYHKRIERKRRDRMRNLYDELRSLVNPDEPADKNSVLAGAVSLIQELRDENIKLQSKVHIKDKRLKLKGSDNMQIKIEMTAEGVRDAEEVAMAGRAREAAVQQQEEEVEVGGQERMSGEETSEGSEQGASKTSDSVTDGGQDGSEQGASKRQRVTNDGDVVLTA